MNEETLKNYLLTSFLAPLLSSPTLNDVSYNGEEIFFEDSEIGRKRSDIQASKDEVASFLRQIANLAEKQFSYQNPIMDVSFSGFRLNACFLNLVRVNDEKSYSFSLRLSHAGSKVSHDESFLGKEAEQILLKALINKEPIIIAGSTSSGKTELQKYLLLKLKKDSRVIVIDNLEELEMIRGKETGIDLTSWVVDPRFPSSSFSSLIRNALRNDPDYIVVAESRGEEMLDILNATMSGHPVISTLHALDLASVPYRMARMAMMGNKDINYEDVLGDIYHHFGLVCYLKKKEGKDGKIIRYLSSLGKMDEKSRSVKVLVKRQL